MWRILFFKSAILTSYFALCQKQIADIDVEIDPSVDEIGLTFYAKDAFNQNQVVVFQEQTNWTFLELNKDFSLQGKSTIPNDEMRQVEGYLLHKDSLVLAFRPNVRNEISVLIYNLLSREFCFMSQSFEGDDEKYLTSASTKDKIYFFNLKEGENVLVVYEVTPEKVKRKLLSFGNLHFSADRFKYTLDDVLSVPSEGLARRSETRILPIHKNHYYTIDQVSQINKIYPEEDRVVLTFDDFPDKTKSVVIDLKTMRIEVRDHLQVTSTLNSNSYLYDDKLFQVSALRNELVLSIRDFESGELLTVLKGDKKNDIPFMDGEPIVQGDPYPNAKYLDLTKTNKLLMKLGSSPVGVTVDEIDTLREIRLGSYQEVETPVYSYSDAILGVLSPLVGALKWSVSPYNIYKSSRSTYFKSTFDSDFKKVNLSRPIENPFEKIFDYLDENRGFSLPVIIEEGDSHILGFYLPTERKFRLVRF